MIKRPKEKELQPRILYPARLSFRNEGEMKNFSDKEKTNSKTKNVAYPANSKISCLAARKCV